MLQEKILKFDNYITSLIKNKTDKNIPTNISSYIQEQLNEIFVVFEFELYLSIDRFYDSENNINFKKIKINDIDIYDLEYYFDFKLNTLMNEYTIWRKKQLKDLDILKKSIANPDLNELNIYFFIIKEFGDLENYIHQHDLIPKYGWVNRNKTAIYDKNEKIIPTTEIISQFKKEFDTYFPNKKVKIYTKRTPTFKIKKEDTWYFEEEPSLQSSDNFVGIEIVSEWIPAKDALYVLNTMRKLIINTDTRTNEDTGLHINIGFKKRITYDPLKIIILTGDLYELEKYERLDNKFCSSQIKSIMTNISILDGFMTNINYLIDKFNKSISYKKETAINFLKYLPKVKKSLIEYRIPGDDYFGIKFNNIEQSMNRFILINIISTNENIFKEEYYQKLLKLRTYMVDNNILNIIDKYAKQLSDDTNENIIYNLLYNIGKIDKKSILNNKKLKEKYDTIIHDLLIDLDYYEIDIRKYTSNLIKKIQIGSNFPKYGIINYRDIIFNIRNNLLIGKQK
jgi:hypothetical protein